MSTATGNWKRPSSWPYFDCPKLEEVALVSVHPKVACFGPSEGRSPFAIAEVALAIRNALRLRVSLLTRNVACFGPSEGRSPFAIAEVALAIVMPYYVACSVGTAACSSALVAARPFASSAALQATLLGYV